MPVVPLPGRCTWTHHFEDVDLWCDDRAIPGGKLCAEHLILVVNSPAMRSGRVWVVPS